MSLADELLSNLSETKSTMANTLTWDGVTTRLEQFQKTNLWRISSQVIEVEDMIGAHVKWSNEAAYTITAEDINDMRSSNDDEEGSPIYTVSCNISGEKTVHITVVTETFAQSGLVKQGIYVLRTKTGWVDLLMSDNDIFDTTAVCTYIDEEPHIVIGKDRFITIPDELKRIAVQYDHNIKTVTFDCPRYWDEHDLSKMILYANYMRADSYSDACPMDNIRVDEEDDTVIHFDWTITRHVTLINGPLSFLICAKYTDEDGNEENHWNSELNQDMTVSKGLECQESILLAYPDIITKMLLRINAISVSEFVMVDDGKGNVEIKGIGLSRAIAEEYSNEKTYELGEYAMYYGGLYKCTAKVTTPEDWDGEKWTSVAIIDELEYAMEELKIINKAIPYKVVIDDNAGTINFIDRK